MKKWKYGSKIFLKDGRDYPWIARLTLGYDKKSYPVYHILGSFEDELDCILCLREYTTNPYGIYIEKEKYDKIVKFAKLPSKVLIQRGNIEKDRSCYTFREVYEEYAKLYFPTKEEIKKEKETHQKARGKLSSDNMYTRKAAYKSASALYDITYPTLRTIDFVAIINSCEGSPKKSSRLKLLFQELDNYAEQKDIISKGYAKFIGKIDSQNYVSAEKRPFLNEEIERLWKQKDLSEDEELIKDILLILLYSGVRIEELLFLFTENIFLADNYFICGLKTENGKNRIVPIHHKIKPIIEKYYNENNKFLIMYKGKKLDYSKYRVLFNAFMEKLKMEHTTHETRHTVESEFDRRSANTVSKNLIMGHKNKGTGEDVYTHKSIQELIDTIELLQYRERKLTYLKKSG